MRILYCLPAEQFRTEYRGTESVNVLGDFITNDDSYILGIPYTDYMQNKESIEEWFMNNDIPLIIGKRYSIFLFNTYEDALLFKWTWEE